MDHLSLPSGANHYLQVPFLEGIPYGFFEYGTRHVWNTESLHRGNIRGARSDWDTYPQAVLGYHPDVASISNRSLVELLVGPFIQNWIFRDLFNTVLQRPISQEEGCLEIFSLGYSTFKTLTTKSFFRELISLLITIELRHGADAYNTLHLSYKTWILCQMDLGAS